MLGFVCLAPAPALGVPEFLATIPVVVDERRELLLRDRGAGDVERPDRDGVRPLFIIEHEGLALRRTEGERASRNRHVTRQGACGFVTGDSVARGEPEAGRGIAQS